MQKSKVVYSDGEGPIVHLDLAAEKTEDVAPGLFPIISLYDDYLAEKETEGYQAGDTLALVVPHFILHGVTNKAVADKSNEAKINQGVVEYIRGLKADGWTFRIISTAYHQMWQLVGDHIGVPMQDIACTRLNMRLLNEKFGNSEFKKMVEEAENKILDLRPLGDAAAEEVDNGRPVLDVFEDERYAELREALDGFYFGTLAENGYRVLEEVKVMGGKRKVEAAKEFAMRDGVELSEVAYIGDSITDDAIHAHLNREGGLPIAINGNSYAIRNARVAIATTDMRKIRPVLDAWQEDGFTGVTRRVQEANQSFSPRKEGSPASEISTDARYHLVDPSNAEAYREIFAVHKDYRKAVRGVAAARLG